jgi:outer membrane protein OmpA-like peptidoglycan-associated protein
MHKATQPAQGMAPTHALQEPHRTRRSELQHSHPVEGYGGNQATLRRLSRTTPHLQCKLQIGAVNDPLEAEADRVADQVMRMPDPAIASSDAPLTLQRKCACEDEENHKLNRKSDTSARNNAEVPSMVHEVLGAPGQPLGADILAFFAPRFGRSLHHVRVHRDARAAESARAVGALAYASGSHIVFSDTAPQSSATAGRHLMAHELTHTMQQAGEPSLRRVCGPQAIGQPAGCEGGDPTFAAGATFRFKVNCDDWADGADAGLLDFAQTIPATSNIQIDGYASIEGPEGFNTNLACARALKAKALLIASGIDASRITRIIDHGATPGKAADRRSVVVQPIASPVTPKADTPDTQPQPQTPKPDETKDNTATGTREERLKVCLRPVRIANDDGKQPTTLPSFGDPKTIWAKCCIDVSVGASVTVSKTAYKTLDESHDDNPTAEETALFADAGGGGGCISIFVADNFQQDGNVGKDISGGGGTYDGGKADPKVVVVEGVEPTIVAHEMGHAMGYGPHEPAGSVMEVTANRHDQRESTNVAAVICNKVRQWAGAAKTGKTDCTES